MKIITVIMISLLLSGCYATHIRRPYIISESYQIEKTHHHTQSDDVINGAH